MLLSSLLSRFSEPETLKMAKLGRELTAKGINIIGLSLGEPDFDTPDHIKEAAKKAIDENWSHYPPVAGYLDLREAVCHKLKRDNDRLITAMYNAATKQIRLNNYNNINYKWQLASLGGSILSHGTARQGLTAINSSNLAKGTYVVICTANNINQNFKLVIY